MRSKRLIYFLIALAALISLGLTFVEGFSDVRALGRQEAGPYIPIISLDGLMGLLRSLNLLLILFILLRLNSELPRENSRQLLINVLLGIFFFLSLISPFGMLLELVPLLPLISFFGLASSYAGSLILIALERKKVANRFDEISILLLAIGCLLPLIILSYLLASFTLIFLLTSLSRGLLFILMVFLLIRFARKLLTK
jgi:hypothetical protein